MSPARSLFPAPHRLRAQHLIDRLHFESRPIESPCTALWTWVKVRDMMMEGDGQLFATVVGNWKRPAGEGGCMVASGMFAFGLIELEDRESRVPRSIAHVAAWTSTSPLSNVFQLKVNVEVSNGEGDELPPATDFAANVSALSLFLANPRSACDFVKQEPVRLAEALRERLPCARQTSIFRHYFTTVPVKLTLLLILTIPTNDRAGYSNLLTVNTRNQPKTTYPPPWTLTNCAENACGSSTPQASLLYHKPNLKSQSPCNHTLTARLLHPSI